MNEITYFIGAGASYNSLPLVNNMDERIRVYRNFLITIRDHKKLKNDFLNQYIEELNSIIKLSKEHVTLDSYAKSLSISTDRNASLLLLRLKIILSGYLLFEQLIKPSDIQLYTDASPYITTAGKIKSVSEELNEKLHTSIDKRYNHFWARYINDKLTNKLNGVNIISWNYDLQFELSYSKIRPGMSLSFIQQELQIFPSKAVKIPNLEKSCILKLNGTAGLYSEYKNPNLGNLIEFENDELILLNSLDIIINFLKWNYHGREGANFLFSFAWEKNDILDQTRSFAKKIIHKTNTLVCIGYSFPEYNHSIDQEIFNNVSNIENIYIQVRREDVDGVKKRLQSINLEILKKVQFEHDLDLFYYPISNKKASVRFA